MNLAELTARMHAIRDHNDWRRYQSPKNLVMAASVEMADVVLSLLQLCSELGLDMNKTVLDKLADNERRFLK